MKALSLLLLLSKDPREFFDRVWCFAEKSVEMSRPRPTYKVSETHESLHKLGTELGIDLSELFGEEPLEAIENHIHREIDRIPVTAPFGYFHNADVLLGRLCYVLVRALRPQKVVESGVCYGVISAHILQAMEVNGHGHLYSIDLPPLAESADSYVGWLIPWPLRTRWSLYRGSTRRLLKSVLNEVDEIDVFIHDSLHTARNMEREFDIAWPLLRNGGVVISDDVEGNGAFLELTMRPAVSFSVVLKEEKKDSLFGIAVKRKE
jgi:predicted O-methyltransferase YrrM